MNGKYSVASMLNLLKEYNCPVIYSNNINLKRNGFITESINSILPYIDELSLYNTKVETLDEGKSYIVFSNNEMFDANKVKEYLQNILNLNEAAMDYNMKSFVILYCQLLSFVLMMTRAINNNSFTQLIDNLDKGSAKTEQSMAPYVKVY